MLLTPDLGYGPEDSVEVEIEKLGRLRVHFLDPSRSDWRSENDPSRTIHHADAVRELIAGGRDSLSRPRDFDASQVRHFWTAFGNYRRAEELEGLVPLTDIPRMLNNPGRAVSADPQGRLARRASHVKVSLELCAVVKKVAYKVSPEKASEYILGYSPMVSIHDQSFFDGVVSGRATGQDMALPAIYARWGDGYNVLLPEPVPAEEDGILTAAMQLQVDGIGTVSASTSEYLVSPRRMLSRLSQYLTLFPGDVLTLGRMTAVLDVPAGLTQSGFKGSGSIDGLGEIHFSFSKGA